jgi:PTS system nitrogen regulatory IIA component
MESGKLPVADAIVDLDIADKKLLLRELARRASASLPIAHGVIFDALVRREELGSTGIGKGVAIPHARMAEVRAPFGILVRLKQPMNFNAVDGQAVDLVFLLLLPAGDESGSLNALSCVARKLRNPRALEELRAAANRALLYTAIMRRDEPESQSAASKRFAKTKLAEP